MGRFVGVLGLCGRKIVLKPVPANTRPWVGFTGFTNPIRSPSGSDTTFVCSFNVVCVDSRGARPGFTASNLWVATSRVFEVVGSTSSK